MRQSGGLRECGRELLGATKELVMNTKETDVK